MSENKVLEELKKASTQSAIPFGIAIIFMGMTSLPVDHTWEQKLGIAIVFLVLGVWVMSSTFWPKPQNRLGTIVRYGITLVAGIGIGMGLRTLI